MPLVSTRPFLLFALIAALFALACFAPDAAAQTLPAPPGGSADDPFSAAGKFGSKGAGYALILLSVAIAIGALGTMAYRVYEYNKGKADWGDITGGALIAVIVLAVGIGFGAYGLKILNDNQNFLEAGVGG